MHENEIPIDIDLVQKLISDQFPEWKALSITKIISSGTDNALYRLGDEYLIRLPRIDWAVDNIPMEANWLPKIAPLVSIPISTPVALGEPGLGYPYIWGIYKYIEGDIAQLGEPIVSDLVSFISSMHRVELSGGPISERGVPLVKREKVVQKALQDLDGMIDTKLVGSIWQEASFAPVWDKPSVWVHGDLSPFNLIVTGGRLCGVIDFGFLGIGDPACDLIVAWNMFNREQRDDFRRQLDVDDTMWLRGMGWALSIALIALPYYKDTNKALASNARHVIDEICQTWSH